MVIAMAALVAATGDPEWLMGAALPLPSRRGSSDIEHAYVNAQSQLEHCARVRAKSHEGLDQMEHWSAEARTLAAQASAEITQQQDQWFAAEDLARLVGELQISAGHLARALVEATGERDVPELKEVRSLTAHLLDSAEWISVRAETVILASRRAQAMAEERAERAEDLMCDAAAARDLIADIDQEVRSAAADAARNADYLLSAAQGRAQA